MIASNTLTTNYQYQPTTSSTSDVVVTPGTRHSRGHRGGDPDQTAALERLGHDLSSYMEMRALVEDPPRSEISGHEERFYDASPLPSRKMDETDHSDDALLRALNTINELLNVSNGGLTPGSRSTGFVKGDPVRTGKVVVELRVVFLKIGEIDTLKEQYSSDVFIQAKWREPALDNQDAEIVKNTDLDKFWNPHLYIDNILSEQKDSTWLTTSTNDKGEAFVFERRKLRGVFLENLELQNFPLDVQDLSVTVTSERPDSEVDLVPDEDEGSAVNIQTFADEQEWKLYEHVEVIKRVIKQEYSTHSRSHSAVQVTCRAARRPGYFYYNVFLVMFFISVIAFGTFSVDPTLPQNRLQLSFTLLLTSIAFKMVINQSLPKISYLTYMDKYVLMSLVFLVVICVWHAIVPSVINQYPVFMSGGHEMWVIIAFAVLYAAGHGLFILWVYLHAWRRRLLMAQKDREYKMRSEFYRASSKVRKWLAKDEAIFQNQKTQRV